MSAIDDKTPYRLDAGATYDRIAQLESELAALRSPTQPQTRALAELHIRHLREDQNELVAQFKQGRNRLHVATATMMLTTFGAFLIGMWRLPLGPLTRIACGVAVTLIAAVGTASQGWVRSHFQARHRKLQRRIEEEQVLAGMDPTPRRALPEPATDPFSEREREQSLTEPVTSR